MGETAIGFRVHSGWAIMVAVAGSPDRPVIVERQRIEIAKVPERGMMPNQTVQPYHVAREMGVVRGKEFLDGCRVASNALACSSLEVAMKRIGGDRVRRCGILMGSGRQTPTLEATLASHPAIHTAEGEFFREVAIHAAEQCGLRVRRIKEKDLFDVASREFRTGVDDLVRGLDELGKTMGPPWRQDHKFAALAGWLALYSSM